MDRTRISGLGLGSTVQAVANAYRVTLSSRLDATVQPDAVSAELMMELGEFGAEAPSVVVDLETSVAEVAVTVHAPTEAVALAKGARLIARGLDGEPVHDVTATVHPMD